MLPRQKRLNLKKDFSWVAAGQKVETSLLKVFFRFSQNPDPKVGIAVSSKTFKKAVERNRARRLISKGWENLYNSLPRGVNLITLPKSGVINLNAQEITAHLESLIKKIDKKR